MRKEVMIAIAVGLILGIIFTFGVYTANQAVKEKKTATTAKVIQNTPAPSPATGLIIDEPENNLVVNQTPLKIAGRTAPKATLVIYSEDNETFTQADEQGLFSANLVLTAGSNRIIVKSIDEENRQEEKKLTIVYTTQLK